MTEKIEQTGPNTHSKLERKGFGSLEEEFNEAKRLIFLLRCVYQVGNEQDKESDGRDTITGTKNCVTEQHDELNMCNEHSSCLWKIKLQDEMYESFMGWNKQKNRSTVEIYNEIINSSMSQQMKLESLSNTERNQLLKYGRKVFPESAVFPESIIKKESLYNLQNTVLTKADKHLELMWLVSDYVNRNIKLLNDVFADFQVNVDDGIRIYMEAFILLADIIRICYVFELSYENLKNTAILYFGIWNTLKSETHKYSMTVLKFIDKCKNPIDLIRTSFPSKLEHFCRLLTVIVNFNYNTFMGNADFLKSTAFFKNIFDQIPIPSSDAFDVSNFSHSLSITSKIHAAAALGFLVCLPVIVRNNNAIDSFKGLFKYSPVIHISGNITLNLIQATIKEIKFNKISPKILNINNSYLTLNADSWFSFHDERRRLSLLLLKKIIHGWEAGKNIPTINVCTSLSFAKDEVFNYFYLAQTFISSFHKKIPERKIEYDVVELIDHISTIRDISHHLQNYVCSSELSSLQSYYIPFAIKLIQDYIVSKPFDEDVLTLFNKLLASLRHVLESLSQEVSSKTSFDALISDWNLLLNFIYCQYIRIPSSIKFFINAMDVIISHIVCVKNFKKYINNASYLGSLAHFSGFISLYYKDCFGDSSPIDILKHCTSFSRAFATDSPANHSIQILELRQITALSVKLTLSLFDHLGLKASKICHSFAVYIVNSRKKIDDRLISSCSNIISVYDKKNSHADNKNHKSSNSVVSSVDNNPVQNYNILRHIINSFSKEYFIRILDVEIHPTQFFIKYMIENFSKFLETSTIKFSIPKNKSSVSADTTLFESYTDRLTYLRSPSNLYNLVYNYRKAILTTIDAPSTRLDTLTSISAVVKSHLSIHRSKRFIDEILTNYSSENNYKTGRNATATKNNILTRYDNIVTPVLVTYVLIYLTLFLPSARVLPVYYDVEKGCFTPTNPSEKMFILKSPESNTDLLDLFNVKELSSLLKLIGPQGTQFIDNYIKIIINKHMEYTKLQIKKNISLFESVRKELQAKDNLYELIKIAKRSTKLINYSEVYNLSLAFNFRYLLHKASRSVFINEIPELFSFLNVINDDRDVKEPLNTNVSTPTTPSNLYKLSKRHHSRSSNTALATKSVHEIISSKSDILNGHLEYKYLPEYYLLYILKILVSKPKHDEYIKEYSLPIAIVKGIKYANKVFGYGNDENLTIKFLQLVHYSLSGVINAKNYSAYSSKSNSSLLGFPKNFNFDSLNIHGSLKFLQMCVNLTEYPCNIEKLISVHTNLINPLAGCFEGTNNAAINQILL